MRFRLLTACLFVLFAGMFSLPARANRDIVQFGSNIQVEPDTSIHDAVCFFCNVEDRGTIEGDIVVFFGNVHVAGHANHDVVNFFGNARVDDDASIRHDMVSLFGGVHLGENALVGHDMVALFGSIHMAASATVGGDRVYQPAWIFWGPLLLFALIVIVVVREIRGRRRRPYFPGYPYPRP